MYCFSGPRYVSPGIDSLISQTLQSIIWKLIDTKAKRKFPLNYLQVFEIIPITKGGKQFLKITHLQDSPRFREIHFIRSTASFVGKVWVIDETDYITMLFPDEY